MHIEPAHIGRLEHPSNFGQTGTARILNGSVTFSSFFNFMLNIIKIYVIGKGNIVLYLWLQVKYDYRIQKTDALVEYLNNCLI